MSKTSAMLVLLGLALSHVVSPLRHPVVAPRVACLVACADESGPDPEEWRAFRAKLISGGLRLTGEEDGGDAVAAAEPPPAERTSVAPQNEALLKEQNEALWREYYGGAWAHESPGIEPGGLVCRLPLPAQLTRQMRAGAQSTWSERMRERLLAGLPRAEGEEGGAGDADESARLVEQWSANAHFTYRLAEGLVVETLQAVSSKATDGRVSWSDISEEQRELVALYSDSQDSWQEVCLVLKAVESASGTSSVASECVVINRPLARSMSPELAALLLNGAEDGQQGGQLLYDEPFVERFLRAFGDEAAVYLGGPERQEERGLVIHGFDLPGATELAPGTKIFTGGVEAIVSAVLDGTRSPLDFRWFIGRRTDVSTSKAAWCPIACARPVVLKQCLGLPKPLWHEVMELCGGEVADVSKIELLKRSDLE